MFYTLYNVLNFNLLQGISIAAGEKPAAARRRFPLILAERIDRLTQGFKAAAGLKTCG